MSFLKVLSIDIGITNLGYVYSIFDLDNEINSIKINFMKTNNDFIEIVKCDRVDITNVKHHRIPFCECKLHHDYCIPDYVEHFIQEQQEMFSESDVIIIERQPPTGITNVQDLIFSKFRDKVQLISPNKIHKYFNMSKDYSIRKKESETISEYYLSRFKKFTNNVRKHDISDAMLMLIYFYSLKLQEINKNKQVKKVFIDFEKFRIQN
jgi:hypothetical protein